MFQDHNSLVVLQDSSHKQKTVRGLVYVATIGGWQVFAPLSERQKQCMCKYVNDNNLGPTVIPSRKPKLLLTAQMKVSLRTLANSLVHAGVPSVALLAYGQKQPLQDTEYLLKGELTRLVPAVWHLGFQVTTEYIPTFLARGQGARTYPMLLELGKGGGSLEVNVEQGITVKIYPNTMHILKAHIKTFHLPKTLQGARVKIGQIKEYAQELRHVQPDLLCGYRVETCITGYYTLPAAVVKTRSLAAGAWGLETCDVTVTARVTPEQYRTHILHVLRNIEGHFTGRGESELTRIQRHYLARTYNATGYWSGWWARYLAFPTIQLHVTPMQQVVPLTPAVREVFEALRVRHSARSKRFICAMYSNGAVSKGFLTLDELAAWVLEKHPTDWKQKFLLRGDNESPREPSIVTRINQYNILEPSNAVYGMPMQVFELQGDMYALYMVPQDHNSFHHSACIILEEEMGGIVSVEAMRLQLRDFYYTLDSDILELTTGIDSGHRALLYHNDITLKGEMVDAVALATIFNLEIPIFLYDRRPTVPVTSYSKVVHPLCPAVQPRMLERALVQVKTVTNWNVTTTWAAAIKLI